MDGFKNTTKTQYFKGGSSHEAKGAAKVAKVMGEFKSGKLHSGSKNGPEVTNRKQATAIAMSEARKAGAKMPMRKAGGGSVEADDALMARMTPKELAMGRAGIAAARARLSGKKLPPKAVPVASKRPLIESKTGGVVKKAVGGPVATLVPKLPGVKVVAKPKLPETPEYLEAKAAAQKKIAAMGNDRAAVAAEKDRFASLPRTAEGDIVLTPKKPLPQLVKKAVGGPVATATQTANNTSSLPFGITPSAAAQAKQKATAQASVASRLKANTAANAAAQARVQTHENARKAAAVSQRAADVTAQRAKSVAIANKTAANTARMNSFDPNHPRQPVKKASGGLAAMPKGKC
jgi:hypothetical protein